MFNLQIIKRPKSQGGNYLGISVGFLIEVMDNDPGLHTLLPKGTHFKGSSAPAYRRHRRLNLLNYSGNCLIVIRSSQIKAGVRHAKLEIYNNKGQEDDLEVLAITQILASYRWPSGVLFVSKHTLKRMGKNLSEVFIRAGWRDMRNESGTIAFLTQLPKPKVM